MWPNLHFPADLVTFTEKILNGKLRKILCSVSAGICEHIWDVYKTLSNIYDEAFSVNDWQKSEKALSKMFDKVYYVYENTPMKGRHVFHLFW